MGIDTSEDLAETPTANLSSRNNQSQNMFFEEQSLRQTNSKPQT